MKRFSVWNCAKQKVPVVHPPGPPDEIQGMTNADGTTGCYPPGRGFESRRVRHYGPVAQRLEQEPAARQGMFRQTLSSCPTTFYAAPAASDEERN